MDYVASVVGDVLQGFGRAEGTLAVAPDLKGAFNAVVPGVLLHQLSELERLRGESSTSLTSSPPEGCCTSRMVIPHLDCVGWGFRRAAFFHPFFSAST